MQYGGNAVHKNIALKGNGFKRQTKKVVSR